MSCHVMIRHVMPCHLISCHVMSCAKPSCRALPSALGLPQARPQAGPRYPKDGLALASRCQTVLESPPQAPQVPPKQPKASHRILPELPRDPLGTDYLAHAAATNGLAEAVSCQTVLKSDLGRLEAPKPPQGIPKTPLGAAKAPSGVSLGLIAPPGSSQSLILPHVHYFWVSCSAL